MIVHHIIRSSPQTCHSEKGTPSLGDVLFTMTYHFRPAPVHTNSGVVSFDHVGVVPLTGPSENTCTHPGPPHTTDFPQPTPASTDNAEYSYIPESIVNVDGNQQMHLHFDYRGFQPDTSSCQATDTSNSPDTRNGGASFPENQEFAFVEPCQAVPQDFSSTSNDSRLSTGTTFYSTNDGARIPTVHQIRECDALGLNGRPFAPYPNLPCQEDCPEYYLATDVSRDAYFWGPKVVHDFQYNAEFHNYQLAREDHRGDLSGHIQSGFVEVHGENFNDGSAVPTSFDGQFLLADGHGHDYYAPSQSPTESLCA
ncbi:hypothetical protein VNI00_012531 [Paramarasmius palmivorus]|uniref:Uncharacterized protein n=1 Tax=Paramarasmius palmivorus TaxID=297713 RepID=A0AAW0C4N0_9AGAR